MTELTKEKQKFMASDFNQLLDSLSIKSDGKLNANSKVLTQLKIDVILEKASNKGILFEEEALKKIKQAKGISINALRDRLKNIKKDSQKVIDTTITTTTSTTFTTNYFENEDINPAGDVFEDIAIEPLGDGYYLYSSNYGRSKKITSVEFESSKKERGLPFLNIEGKKYYFSKEPLLDRLPFATPSKAKLKNYINGTYNSNSISKLITRAVNYEKTIFEVDKEEDYFLDVLGSVQSWLRVILRSVYHVARDGTKGSGKTSFGEFTSIISRHGMTVGDLSGALLGRVVESYQASLHIDEIDQINGEKKNQIEGILRKSQRRDNPYSRVNPDSGLLQFFDTFNFHNFSFRTSTEDALAQRAYIIRTRPTKDYRLALLTINKKHMGFPLYEDFFFWYMDNIALLNKKFGSESSVSSEVVKILGGLDKFSHTNYDRDQINRIRNELWDAYSNELTAAQKDLLRKLVGRYSEIGYNLLHMTNILEIDFFKYIEKAILSKQSEEKIPEQVYLKELQDYLVDLFHSKKDIYDNGKRKYILSKGQFVNCFYYSKHRAYLGYIKKLRDDNLPTIGSPKFMGYLKDIGFIQNYNIKNQKPEKNPELSIIYSREILDSLDLPAPIVLDLQEDHISSDLLGFLNSQSKLPIDIEHVLSNGFSEDQIEDSKRKGDIYEPMPGKISVL